MKQTPLNPHQNPADEVRTLYYLIYNVQGDTKSPVKAPPETYYFSKMEKNHGISIKDQEISIEETIQKISIPYATDQHKPSAHAGRHSALMPCYKPLEGYRSRKGGITFNRTESMGQPMSVPCGRCIGCRITRTREWAIRCIHEAQMHEHNCFITLTYSPENLPEYGTLVKHHFQDFMKRLRKHYGGKKIRYYMCGEYGADGERPHYHACLFGLDFEDLEEFSRGPAGPIYTSEVLSNLWKHGFHTIGEVTWDSAAYVARYVIKKKFGNDTFDYDIVDPGTGEVLFSRVPEYTTMSLKPGIGATWYKKYVTDVFPDDFIIHDGNRYTTPRYYRTQLEKDDPELAEQLKLRRIAIAMSNIDNTPERLAIREEIQDLKVKKLTRQYEEKNDT